MLSGACPSCGAPVVFAHAAAISVVCGNCRSTVVRDGVNLSTLGKVSSFSRDLSPLQVGAKGRVGKGGFEVVGVVRLGRDRVRWNEWFLVFDSGDVAWLAEGNELYQLFRKAPAQGRFPNHHDLRVGQVYAHAEVRWRAIEVSTAYVLAAEGSLPYAPVEETPRPYADLREEGGGRSATLDYELSPAVLYVGEVVELASLAIEGLRNFTGWTDPALTGFAGPEVKSTRTLKCPACGAPAELRAPGQTQAYACAYCGSDLSVDEHGGASELVLVSRAQKATWKPTLPLGARGKLGGLPWVIIGAMERSVRVDGVRYPWTEYLLHNPYRGFRWLSEDAAGQWSLIQRLPGVPARVGSNRVAWRDERFNHFQSGRAVVDNVLGEFTWEVHKGDEAQTDDYVSPPRMLSRESTGDEEVWTLGTWLPAKGVGEAFGKSLSEPFGVAPHQPNPWQERGARAGAYTTAAIGCGAAVMLWILQSITSASEVLLEQSWQVGGSTSEEVYVSNAFEIPDKARRNLEIAVDSSLDRQDAELHVAVVHQGTGDAWLPELDEADNEGSARISSPPPGKAMVRVEVAKDPARPTAGYGATVQVKVLRDTPWRTPLYFALLIPLFAPIALLLASGQFEQRRWANSDHA